MNASTRIVKKPRLTDRTTPVDALRAALDVVADGRAIRSC
jgi:hypothetical protein